METIFVLNEFGLNIVKSTVAQGTIQQNKMIDKERELCEFD